MIRTAAAILAVTGLLLTGCSKGTQSTTTTTTTAATAASATQAPAKIASASGASVYQTNCSSCHGADGKGAPGAFPPLAHNPFVTGPAGPVIGVLKNGLTGPVKVGSQTYNGQMPAWKSTLSNDQIAAVITHIRTSFGNSASAVTSAQVAAAK